MTATLSRRDMLRLEQLGWDWAADSVPVPAEHAKRTAMEMDPREGSLAVFDPDETGAWVRTTTPIEAEDWGVRDV